MVNFLVIYTFVFFRFKLYIFPFFYGDWIAFVYSSWPWSYHGGHWYNGVISGEFAISHSNGHAHNHNGSRLLEYLTIIYFSLDYYFFVIHEYYRSLIPILLVDKNLNGLL